MLALAAGTPPTRAFLARHCPTAPRALPPPPPPPRPAPQLPPDLKTSLVSMLACDSIEGYIRPGCVHVTVDAMMSSAARQSLAEAGLRSAVETLIASRDDGFWAERTMLLQLGSHLALVRDGQVVHVLSAGSCTKLLPRITAARPLAFAPAPAGEPLNISIWGYNLDGEEDTVLARQGGKRAQGRAGRCLPARAFTRAAPPTCAAPAHLRTRTALTPPLPPLPALLRLLRRGGARGPGG